MIPIQIQCYSFEKFPTWCRVSYLCSHCFVIYICSSLCYEFALDSPVGAGLWGYLYSIGSLQVSDLVGCLLGQFYYHFVGNSLSIKFLSGVREFVNWFPRVKDVVLYLSIDDNSLSDTKSWFSNRNSDVELMFILN